MAHLWNRDHQERSAPTIAISYPESVIRRASFLLLAFPLLAQNFEVEEATISQVHDAMKAGRLTCRALVGLYLKRIEAYDKNGPAINSIVTINPDVEKQAEELDRRFAQSGLTGHLHCMAMIV
jgi:amidase